MTGGLRRLPRASVLDAPAPDGAHSPSGPVPEGSITRNRRAPLSAQEQSSAIGCDSERPTPTVSGEWRPFASAASEPRRLRDSYRASGSRPLVPSRPYNVSGDGRSRAERPTVAGYFFHCAAMALRDEKAVQTRQFMIGGSIVQARARNAISDI